MSDPIVLVPYQAFELLHRETGIVTTSGAAGLKVYLATDIEAVVLPVLKAQQDTITAQMTALEDVRHTLKVLRDYTYVDAEPPELRAQNQRCHIEATRLLARLSGDTK